MATLRDKYLIKAWKFGVRPLDYKKSQWLNSNWTRTLVSTINFQALTHTPLALKMVALHFIPLNNTSLNY